MPLTHDEQLAVAQYLKTNASPPKCPVCGASNMQVQKEVVLLPYRDKSGEHQPVISVECQYCGHILHFSPEVIGLSLG